MGLNQIGNVYELPSSLIETVVRYLRENKWRVEHLLDSDYFVYGRDDTNIVGFITEDGMRTRWSPDLDKFLLEYDFKK